MPAIELLSRQSDIVISPQWRWMIYLLTGIAFAGILIACMPEKESQISKEPGISKERGISKEPGISSEPVSEPEPVLAGQIDPESGLLIDDNWQLVRTNCTACHSAQLVTQNRGSRQAWLEMIRWMQETQGLWSLDAVSEKGILDYLEKNYAPLAVHRRAPLPQVQMPPNPYPE